MGYQVSYNCAFKLGAEKDGLALEHLHGHEKRRCGIHAA